MIRTPYSGFAKLLHTIAAKRNVKEAREEIVKTCETDDILFLLDVLEDYLNKEPIKWERKRKS